MMGKLYGIGIGPGDPELITLKAKRILEEVDLIAVPKAGHEETSVALDIVRDFIRDKKIVEFIFPMSHNKEYMETSWKETADEIRRFLEEGLNIAFITLGDPTVYSTYMYVDKLLREQGVTSEIVPGITSFSISAARARTSLVQGKESMAIISSTDDQHKLNEALDHFDTIVLMKISANYEKIREILRRKNLIDRAFIGIRCGFDEERMEYDLEKVNRKDLSYFSTMIIKKKGVK